MIDLHCHLLPGIDDGPAEVNESVELARYAVRNGITHAVVTPHIHPGRWDNDRYDIAKSLYRLRMRLAAAKIPLRLSMAAEVRLCPEIMQLVAEDKIPYLGLHRGRKVILLELPHSHIPMGTENMIGWLLRNNIQPMIAHPERNKDVIRKLDKIRPILEQGCLLQLTSGAVAGQFGEGAQRRARELLEMGAVFALATDAHNLRHRPPNLTEGVFAAREIIGSAATRKLVFENPLGLVQSQVEVTL